MGQKRNYEIPEKLRLALKAIQPGIDQRSIGQAEVERVLALLDEQPSREIERLAGTVRWTLSLYYYERPRSIFPALRPRTSEQAFLTRHPGLEQLYLFHENGRMREFALGQMQGPARSAFFVTTIAYRLNDWAPQVRAAAVRCAERVFPLTSPEHLATAAIYLVGRRGKWQRWAWAGEVAALDEAIRRPDVADRIVEHLVTARYGAKGRLLRQLLMKPGFDDRLALLARTACLPDVRAVATQTLLEGVARWPSHRDRVWLDRTIYHFRRVWRFAERPLDAAIDRDALILQAARDRGPAVRRMAALMLVTRGRELPNFDEVAEILTQDSSESIRERALFAVNMKTGAATRG